MKNSLILTVLLVVLTDIGLACMRTSSGGGGDIPVRTTTISPITTTTPSCAFMNGNAPLFVAAGTTFVDNNYGSKTPVGNCQMCAGGAQNYYVPAMDPLPHQTNPLEAIGSLTIGNCPNMCVCTAANVCYTRATDNTAVTLWPYCVGGTCSTYGYLSSLSTSIIPVGGGAPILADNQHNLNTLDPKPVTDPSYPVISRVGCNGCPVATC